VPWGSAASGGLAVAWLSVIVVLPLAAVVARSLDGGLGAFWDAISSPRAVAALELTIASSAIVAVIDAVMGTLIAWVLVRDSFRGKALVNALIDLPFALPTIVAGLTLLALEPEVEEAAASLGASNLTIFRRIILPALRPAILAGVGLAFGRALGEFGAVVLISGNLPFKTEVASVFVYGQIESDAVTSAAAVSVVLMLCSLAILLAISYAGREVAR